MTDGNVTITPEQLRVIEEALGDAYAYRQGEAHPDELGPEDAEPMARYLALAEELGMAIT